IHLDVQLGGHTSDYAEFVANDKLTWQHLCMQQLVEQVEHLLHSPLPQWQEEHFQQTSKSTNQWVTLWSILWTFILVAIGIWQIQYLQSFLKAKKLV
ncbi:TMED9 protein, partial [Crocuta crocuta]